MARVSHQKSARRNGPAGSTRGAQTAKNRKTQKVVLESNSKDDNIRSVISFRAEPPPGYTFIPAGNPQLTSALKEFARRENRKIHQTTPHASRHELSREVHRVGYHFPTDIVAKVCAHYGIRLTSGGRVINENNNSGQIVMRVYQKGQLVLDEKVQDQVTINTDARETIKDLFPKIPDNDLFQIIKTAFQLGDGKVGTADEIPLVRRAQLSVVAHIRHTYTNYDRLLRRLPYNEARHQVEDETLKKLVEWRGDDDEKTDESRRRAVDDLVRDVIVVSDDEDSNSDVDDGSRIQQENLRIEELPSDAYAPQMNRVSPSRDLMLEEAPAGYRFVPQIARRARLTDAEIDAQNRHRLAVWERARQAYRSRLPEPEPQYEKIYLDRTPPARTLIPLDPPTRNVIRREYIDPIPIQPSQDYEMLPPSRPISPRYSGVTADGRRYERISLNHQLAPIRRGTPPRDMARPPSRPLTPMAIQYSHRRSASPDVGHGIVLPSIEGSSVAGSPRQARQPNRDQTRTWPTPPSNFVVQRNVQRQPPAIIDLTSSQESTSRSQWTGDSHDNVFQARDPQIFCENVQSISVHQLTQPYRERRVLEPERPGPGTVERIFRDDAYPLQETHYREIRGIDEPGTRRILVPDDNVQYRRIEASIPVDAYTRTNPFETRSSTSQYRVADSVPANHQYARSENHYRAASPPRRLLEPVESIRDPMQYYNQGSQVQPLGRRMVYTAPPQSTDPGHNRRYERIPETTYARQ